MSKENGGPAFPAMAVAPSGDVYHDEGMTLRDWFAGQALVGMLPVVSAAPDDVLDAAMRDDGFTGIARDFVASVAYRYADAMLAERERDQ